MAMLKVARADAVRGDILRRSGREATLETSSPKEMQWASADGVDYGMASPPMRSATRPENRAIGEVEIFEGGGWSEVLKLR